MNSNEQQLLDFMKRLFPTFTCTMQDLRTPTEEFVTNFYNFWLMEFEVNITTIPQIQFSQMTMNVNCYHDTYASTIPKINLLLVMKAFNVVPDFGMLDIISPTPKRTQTVIKAFCDFYHWCDNHIGTMIDMKKEKDINGRKQLLNQMILEKSNLQDELNNVLKTIGQLQDTKKELEVELLKYSKIATELRMETDVMKTKSEEANEKLREEEAVLHKIVKEESQVNTKMKDLSNQIVNSPTAILIDLKTLRMKNDEMKTLSEQKRDTLETKMKAQDNLEKVLSSVEEKSVQLEELLRVIEHQRKLLQIVSDVEKITVGVQEELKELKTSLLSVLTKKTSRQEELLSCALKWKNMKDQLTQSLDAAKNELNSLLNEKSKRIVNLQESQVVEEDIASIMEKIKEEVKAFEEEQNRLLKEHDEFLERFKNEGIARWELINKEIEKRGLLNKNKKPSSKK